MILSVKVTNRQIADQFITAFEGGSNYWCQRARIVDENGQHVSDTQIDNNPDILQKCTITIQEFDNSSVIQYADIQRGLEVMAEKYPQHFADLLNGNDDATTGDVFLQCCCFGELVYC